MAQTLRLLDAQRAGCYDSAIGKAPRPSTITLAVPGMHCGGCMRKVEQALATLPGVASARANLSVRRVTVAADGHLTTPEPYIAALQGAGFDATVLADIAPSTGANRDVELVKRLGVAGFAAANIMLLSVSVWSGHAADMPAATQTLFHWLSALIALPAIAYAGLPFFASARSALAARRLNMDVPISLGVVLATGMSLFQTVRGSDQVYFDAAITLLFFLLVGRALDQSVRARAASAAENLLGLRSPAASVIQHDGTIERVATREVAVGMRILVAAGERVPVDALLRKGTTDVDESLITGESRPRHVVAGDPLYAGTINLSAPVDIEAITVADDTLLADIARLMQTAEQARGRYVRLADRAAQFYAPAVHVLGLGTFIGWTLSGQGWEAALTAAIAVLIITCPCALALAVPAVQVVATSRLFRHGVVLKPADGLERLAEVDTIVLDKTGTLTLGEPRVVNVATLSDAVLARSAALAVQSRHPFARAVVRASRERCLEVPAAVDVRETAGAGLSATIDGVAIRLGSAAHCDIAFAAGGARTLWFREGDGRPVALTLDDTLRPDAEAVARALFKAGYAVEILSGDQTAAVAEVAVATGITQWRAAQRPDDKIRRLEQLKREGRTVLMVGDGLNDAPALAAGHASMSPATAVDISQTAADAVFQGEPLVPILEALTVAKAARRRALENFAIAIGYNIVFVPLAVAGLVTPLVAAVAMSASSIAVTANALRLTRNEEGMR